ncbi:MAG: hypothetical protein AAF657_23140, partial [Acidobacteriota bacterium]
MAEADERRAISGQVPHYAVAHEVDINPWDYGQWELRRGDLARWRLRLRSPGGLSLSLAFERYQMPAGGRMMLVAGAGSLRVGPFTEADNDDHGELWTPPMPTDDLRIEVEVPFDALGELQI